MRVINCPKCNKELIRTGAFGRKLEPILIDKKLQDENVDKDGDVFLCTNKLCKYFNNQFFIDKDGQFVSFP